ncbi:helix-turn-helix domain-containing protein [Thalassotalea fusca]
MSTTHIHLKSYNSESHIHAHGFHQVVFPVCGALELRIGHDENLLNNHNVAIIAAGEEHAYSASTDNQFIVVDIPHSKIPYLANFPAFSSLDLAFQKYLQFMLLYLNGTGGCHQIIGDTLVALLEERFSKQVNIDKRIVAVKAFIDNHENQLITIPQLASIGCLSVRHLNELFRTYYGQSTKQYIIEKRMEKAKQLLIHSNDSISKIAEQVGYASVAAFSERFNQVMQISPSVFRRKSKN